MKKSIIYIVLLLICMFPFVVVEADDVDKVKITNVELDSKSETVVVGEPTIEGVSIKFDLKFKEVNQFAKYKVTLKNDDTEDYELVSDKDTETSDYITYEYEINGESIIKAGEEKIVYVTATYTVEVPASELDDSGMYKESNASSIELVAGSLEVPDTLKNAGIVGILVIVGLIITAVVMIKNNKKASVMMIMMALLLVPFAVSALKQIKINVSAEIKINPGPSKFCVISFDNNVPVPSNDIDSGMGDYRLGVVTFDNKLKAGEVPDFNKTYYTFNDGDTFENTVIDEQVFRPQNFMNYNQLKCLEKTTMAEATACMEENVDEEIKACYDRVPMPGSDATAEEIEAYMANEAECYNLSASKYFTKILDTSYGCYQGFFGIPGNDVDK